MLQQGNKQSRADMYDTSEGFYIQNILPGPLVICDPPNLRQTGLYLDPIQPGEIADLSYYDPQALARSMALNNALRHGYAMRLSPQEYEQQCYLNDQRQERDAQEIQRQMVAAEAAGTTFEAEQINLATAGNPHGDYSSEALLSQKGSAKDSDNWVVEYHKALADGIVSDPVQFKELVESGRIHTQMSNRGRRVSVAQMHDFGNQDQVQMTATEATIAMPGSYKQGDEERGGVYTQKRALTNFNATGQIVGGTNQYVDDAPEGVYASKAPRNPGNLPHPGHEESLVEEVDLKTDDNAYAQQKRNMESEVAQKYAPQSPYLKNSPNKPLVRR